MLYGLGASVWWGLGALYYSLLTHVQPIDVLAHRIVWSGLILASWVLAKDGGAGLRRSLENGILPTLLVTAVLLAARWFVFIWAVTNSQVLQVSLGYFLSPLTHVLLGRIALGERLRAKQRQSALLALMAVGIVILLEREPPTTAIALAGLFAVYNLVRKKAPVESLPGLAIEMAILAPAALAFLFLRGGPGFLPGFEYGLGTILLLLGSGLFTSIPLLWFVEAARRLQMTILGFIHYITPTMHFFVAVFALEEPVSPAFLAGLGFTWVAIGLFSLDAYTHSGGKLARGGTRSSGRSVRSMARPGSSLQAAQYLPDEVEGERTL